MATLDFKEMLYKSNIWQAAKQIQSVEDFKEKLVRGSEVKYLVGGMQCGKTAMLCDIANRSKQPLIVCTSHEQAENLRKLVKGHVKIATSSYISSQLRGYKFDIIMIDDYSLHKEFHSDFRSDFQTPILQSLYGPMILTDRLVPQQWWKLPFKQLQKSANTIFRMVGPDTAIEPNGNTRKGLYTHETLDTIKGDYYYIGDYEPIYQKIDGEGDEGSAWNYNPPP